MWCGIAALIVPLVTGFIGMAHKEVCLSQSSHCSGDVLQNVLIVFYFGSLIVLALSIVVGVIIRGTIALRALMKHRVQS